MDEIIFSCLKSEYTTDHLLHLKLNFYFTVYKSVLLYFQKYSVLNMK